MEIQTSLELKSQYLKFLCGELDFIFDIPSLFVVSAHPDDEVIGLGAQIPRLKNATFIHTTDGAPDNMKDADSFGIHSKEEYKMKRYAEFCNALSAAGVSMPSCVELGYTDQQSSLYLTRLTNDFVDILGTLKPEVIITHPYEGGHPDHDSTAFAVHSACALLKRKGADIPVHLEFSSYHSDNGRMSTFDFLSRKDCTKIIVSLSEEDQQLKKKLFDCFNTQKNVLQYFPVNIECFRDAPAYDFTSPPHQGKLYYEYFDWGMNGALWRRLAKEAIYELNL